MRFRLRQLEVFLATAHFQNISRAANSLAMSQSAASSALKELEQQFDIQLFDRVGKRLKLNALGEQVRMQAENLCTQAKELEHALMQRSEFGLLKVGATMTIGHDLAIDLIDTFKQTYPTTELELMIANTEQITQRVEQFDLDIGMIEGELTQPHLESIQWREDTLTLFCHPQHPLAQQKKVSDQQLLKHAWILRELGSGTRQTFDRAMHDLLPHLNISLELQLPSAIKQAVSKNLGIGCLSKDSLLDDFKQKRFIEIQCPKRNFKRHFYIILHRKKYRSADLARWLKLCGIAAD